MIEDYSKIIIAGARRYLRKMGLKEKDLTKEQMDEILVRLMSAAFDEDD